MTLALGLDIGSTTTKAVLVDVAEEVTVVRVARLATPGGVTGIIGAAAAVSRECAASATSPIAAVGIASMAESGAALDADGAALTPLLRWDRRVDRTHLDALLADHPGLAVATGIPATTKPTAVALTALRAEQPELHARLRHWAGAADLVAHALTGVRATDHTLAARTMLAGRGDRWCGDVVGSLGLREEMLPALRAPGEAVGPTTGDAAAFGLTPGTPVHIAGHDHAVGAWAAGCRRPGETADSLGTSEAIVRIADAVDVPHAVAEGFAVGRTVDGRAITVLGGSPACGALLAWWEERHPDDRILERLSALHPGPITAPGSLALPYPSGRQCPRPDPHARVRWVGEEPRGADARARAVLHALVCHARWMRDTADDLAGAPTTALAAMGSLLARVPAWAPLIAAGGPPAWTTAVAEPVAAGAALLAATREDTAAEGSTLPRERVIPLDHPERHDLQRRFLAAVAAPFPTPEGEA